MSLACRVCGNDKENRIVSAREMMFATREVFDYLECSVCGTVQIVVIPDLSRHYPPDYLSFDSEVFIAETAARRMLAPFIGRYLLHGTGFVGKRILKSKPWLAGYFPESLRRFPIGLQFESKILDFGCGTGALIRSLSYFGFTDLTGADAFIDKDISYPNGVTVTQKSLDQLDPAYDLIMLHHSFEHLPDPQHSLIEIRRLMHDESWCLIRIPVRNFAWEKYGVDWVQMDPPRHLFLYTEAALRRLAGDAGLSVKHVYYDSGAFQFWGSEQYRMDIPLTDKRSWWNNSASTLFTDEQIDAWTKEAASLNEAGRGDMACFYLQRS